MILCLTLCCPFQTEESQAAGDLTTVTCNAPFPFRPPPLDHGVCPVAPDPDLYRALVLQALASGAVGPGARCDGLSLVACLVLKKLSFQLQLLLPLQL
jgi:hypothetical protein